MGAGVAGVVLVEGSPSPEDDPSVEEESSEEELSVAPDEEGTGAGLSAMSPLTPSSGELAELKPLPSSETPPDEAGIVAGVVVADFDSEASSSPDDHEEVEGEALIGADDDDVDDLSPSVELPLVFGLSPEESSDPASADEPSAVEFACVPDDRVPEEWLTRVPDAAAVGE
jgi:hypothetical protein